MRLRYGPHAGRLAEQVMLRDPQYALRCMAERPQGVLAGIFADLVVHFDARPFSARCVGCSGPVFAAYAYATLTELAPLCNRCVATPRFAPLATAHRIVTVEDALRHVAQTVPGAHRYPMRRIVTRLALAKGGPARATEAAARIFFHGDLASPKKDLIEQTGPVQSSRSQG